MRVLLTPLQEDHNAPRVSTFALGPQAPIHACNRALKVWAFSRSWKRRNTFSSWRGIGPTGGGEWRQTNISITVDHCFWKTIQHHKSICKCFNKASFTLKNKYFSFLKIWSNILNVLNLPGKLLTLGFNSQYNIKYTFAAHQEKHTRWSETWCERGVADELWSFSSSNFPTDAQHQSPCKESWGCFPEIK